MRHRNAAREVAGCVLMQLFQGKKRFLVLPRPQRHRRFHTEVAFRRPSGFSFLAIYRGRNPVNCRYRCPEVGIISRALTYLQSVSCCALQDVLTYRRALKEISTGLKIESNKVPAHIFFSSRRFMGTGLPSASGSCQLFLNYRFLRRCSG